MLAQDALEKLKKACSYRELCQFDVQQKLQKWSIDYYTAQNIIADLISANFINEERYAKAYVADKVNLNAWGEKKIIYQLKKKHISPQNIEKAIAQIDQKKYKEAILKLIQQKNQVFNQLSAKDRKQKVINFLMNRGFHYHSFKDLL